MILTCGTLVPKLTEEEKRWLENATDEQLREHFGEVGYAILKTDVTYLYRRPYRDAL